MNSGIDQVITPRVHDVGGFEVRRALPAADRKTVGPFVFFDEMGPGTFAAATGLDVRPHPHIGLATATYLFAGGIVHRDNLGTVLEIEPGDVNWMIAGRGIVHSERTGRERRADGHTLHGIQAWIGLPQALEDCDPAFVHYPAAALPQWTQDGVWFRLIAGTAFGRSSPVEVASPTLYAHVQLPPASAVCLPTEYEERAVYVVTGGLMIGGEQVGPGALAILEPAAEVRLETSVDTRLMLIGGAPLDGNRYLRWNFVAADRETINQAERDWNSSIAAGFRSTRFTLPPDEHEFIALPGTPSGPPEPCPECPTT